MCDSADLPSQIGKPTLCGATAILFMYAALLLGFSWASIAVHSAISSIRRDSSWMSWKTMILTYAFIIVGPFVLIIIAVSFFNDQIISIPLLPVCFIADAAERNMNNPSANLGLYYVPIMICALISIIGVSIVIFFSLQVPAGTTWHIQNNIRLIAFLVIGLAWCVTNTAYYGWAQSNQDKWHEVFTLWANAAVIAPSPRPFIASEAPNWIMAIIIFSPTWTLPLFFGSQKILWVDWRHRISPLKGVFLGISTSETTASNNVAEAALTNSDNFMSDLQ